MNGLHTRTPWSLIEARINGVPMLAIVGERTLETQQQKPTTGFIAEDVVCLVSPMSTLNAEDRANAEILVRAADLLEFVKDYVFKPNVNSDDEAKELDKAMLLRASKLYAGATGKELFQM